MPAINRESIETVDIGRGNNYYEPRTSQFKPIRRSSTLRSDEWDYYDRTVSSGRGRYDDYRPRYEEVEVYERPSRPVSYQENIYYDRWQGNPGPQYVSPVQRHNAQSQAVGLRPRPRSPSPTPYYEVEREIIADRSNRFTSKKVPPNERGAVTKRRTESEPIPGLFQTVFDVNHPQDTSVHLELPITDDYETELEAFSRLGRLGNFGAAEEYFKNNLEPYLSNPYVFVQLGQMLLEKGDYLALERLNAEAVFDKEDSPTSRPREETVVVERIRTRSRARSRSWSRPRERRRETKARARSQSPVERSRQEPHARFDPNVRIVSRRSRSRSVDSFRRYYERDRDYYSDLDQSPDGEVQLKDTKVESDFDELELLRQNWKLMRAICNIYTKGDYEDAFDEAWYTIDNFHFGAGIGSTEIQLVKLALQVCAHIGRVAPERFNGGLREAAREWIEWPALCKELLVQGRIWDFKDLYVESVKAFADPGSKPFFGTEDKKRSLVDDWMSEEGDESTNLALLDLLLGPAQLRSVFLDETKSRAESIIAHSPSAMRSRSFIRWILASATDALNGEKKGEDDLWLATKTHIHGFPGMVWHSQDCFLPGVYVPKFTENPGWIAPELSLAVHEPIRLALNLAKELKDYKSQVACLKLLIFQSPDPTQLFQELASLQKSMQGDKEGHLETLLSSYLVCKDRPAKEKLLRELQQTDDWRDNMMLRDGLIYWTRDFIERALKRSLQGPKSTARLRNPANFYIGKGLPWEAEQFTRQNTELDSLPHTTYRVIRDGPAPPPPPPPIQAHGQQIVRNYLEPSSHSRIHSQWPEPRPQSPPNPRDNEDYNRREREETERLRIEVIKEREDREKRNQQDLEMQARLKEAEERWRLQEEINKRQTEEMAKKAAEMEQLEKEFKLAKEMQDREARAQKDQETRERLERAELSLRDQAERLRRAEDRSFQEWLAGREAERKERGRWRRTRRRRRASVETWSLDSSDSYRRDSSSSSEDESSDDNIPRRRRMRNNKTTSSDDEEESDREIRVNRRRLRSVEDSESESRRDEADHQDGDDIANFQRNPCTDLVLYRGVQITMSPDVYVAGPSLIRSPTSPPQYQEDVDGPTNILTAETTRRIDKMRSKKGKKEKRAHKRAAASRNSMNPDDITISVKGMGSVTIDGAQLDSKDGDDIAIRTKGKERSSHGGIENASSHSQGEVKGGPKNTDPTATDDTTKEAISSFPPAAQPLRREELDDLYKSVRRSVDVEERERPAQRQARLEKEERLDMEYRDRLRSRFSTHDLGPSLGAPPRLERRSSSYIPPRRRTSENGPREGNEGRAEGERESTQGSVRTAPSGLIQLQRSALERARAYTQDQTGHLTAEPQVVDQLDQPGPHAVRNSDENDGPSKIHRSDSRNRDELQSKQQNAKIANRPTRPASIGRYGSPHAPMYESTGIWDASEESRSKRAPRANRRMIIVDPGPSSGNTSRVSARARSRPSSMQEMDDIVQPVARRTPWLDYPPVSAPAARLQSPTKRQSLIIDADGRPQPIRTTSENRRSHPGDPGSSPYIRTRRGGSADGRRSKPEMPAPVAGSHSRPHSMVDFNARHHPPGPDSNIPERLPAESWEKGTDGFWKKKKSVSTVHEDPEEGDDWGGEQPQPQPQTNEGGSSKLQASVDPEQGISRKSTVADPEPNEE